jgi:hypothetical protein
MGKREEQHAGHVSTGMLQLNETENMETMIS